MAIKENGMNKEEIIRMAREAGMIGTGKAGNELERLYREAILDALPRFAALVASAEREACAQIAFNSATYIEAAKAIRARGEQ